MNHARRLDRRAILRKTRRLAVKSQFRRGLMAERLEERSLLAADLTGFDSAYWNSAKPTDVTHDGHTYPVDALEVINVLNSHRHSYQLPQNVAAEGETSSRLYVDVNNDGWVTPADALEVINVLNAGGERADLIAKKVGFTVLAVNAAGTPITSIQKGQDFFVSFVADDLRDEVLDNQGIPLLRGVNNAYLDILYNSQFAVAAVAEVQTITLPSSPAAGSFVLGATGLANTATVNYVSSSGTANQAANVAALQTAVNTIFGAGKATVSFSSVRNYLVKFTGALNVNEPKMSTSTAGLTGFNVVETIQGDPADTTDLDGDGIPDAFFSAATFDVYSGNNGDVLDVNGANATNQSKGYTTLPFATDAPNEDAPTGGDRIINDLGGSAVAIGLQFGTAPKEVARFHMIAMLPSGTDTANLVFTPRVARPNPTPPPDFNSTLLSGDEPLVEGNSGSSDPDEGIGVAVPDQVLLSAPYTLAVTSGPIHADSFTAPAINEGNSSTIVIVPAHADLNQGQTGSVKILSAQDVNPAAAGTVSVNTSNQVIFTPNPSNLDFNGTVTFTYTAQHIPAGGGAADFTAPPATIMLPINAVNDAPKITAPGSASMQENTPLTFTGANAISVTDVDFAETGTSNVETLDLTVAQGTLSVPAGVPGVTGNNSGHVTVSGTLTDIGQALAGLTYTATDNPSSSVSLQISVNDNGNVGSGGPLTANASVTINITAQNDAPVNLDNGAPIVNGTHIVAIPDQPFTFSAHSHTFTVADPDSSNLTVTVALANASQGTLQVTGGNPGTSVQLTGSVSTINTALASLTYTPVTGVTAPAVMTITSSDGVAAAVVSTISLDLDPGVRPFPLDDAFQFNEGDTAVKSLDVLVNDFKDASATTTIVAVGTPMVGNTPVGSVVIHSGGLSLDFTPSADTNFFTPGAPITFTYTIHDDIAPANDDRTATVSIRFTNLPDNPVAADDGLVAGNIYATTIGTSLTIDAAHGLLSNDSDVDNSYGVSNYATLSVVGAPATIPTAHGSVVLAATGSFVYTPAAGFLGDDTFTYKALATTPEGTAQSDTATVTIHVASPPVAKNDHFTVLEQGNPATSGNVLADNGNGIDDDPTEHKNPLQAVNLVQISDPTKGSVTLNTDGTFTYNPPTGQNFNTTRPPASDITFTYQAKATDGRLSNVATVSLTVQEVNDNPTAADVGPVIVVKQNATGTIGVHQSINIPSSAISIAPDVQETLKITAVNGTNADANGNTAKLNTTGLGKVYLENFQIKYDAPQNTGADSFTYTVSDFDATTGVARGGSATANVTLDIKEFVPKVITGTIYVDSGNGVAGTQGNGLFDSGEKPLAGIKVHLTGTDVTGASVNLVSVTDANGNYVFPDPVHDPNLPAGYVLKPPATGTSYSLTEDQPSFLLNGLDTNLSENVDTNTDPNFHQGALVTNTSRLDNAFLLAWSLTDQSGFDAQAGISRVNGLNFGEAGIDLRSTAQGGSLIDTAGFKMEYNASSGQNGFVFGLQLGSSTPLWSWKLDPMGDAWDNYTGFTATLSADLTTLTFVETDAMGGTHTAILHQDYNIPGSTARFRILGVGTNGQYIIRVDGSYNGSSVNQPFDGMFAATTPNSNGSGGEGEAPVNQQYAGAADAVFTEKSWA